MRPWPGAPGCWPRRRPVPGVCCFSLRRPYSVPDSTAAVARSFDSCASSVPTRPCDAFAAFAVRRSRAFSFLNALSAVFWRRDRRRALRNSASAATGDPDRVARRSRVLNPSFAAAVLLNALRRCRHLPFSLSLSRNASCSRWRSRATSLRSDISVLPRCVSTPASPSSRVRRATSACRASAFFAARRAWFASSAASARSSACS